MSNKMFLSPIGSGYDPDAQAFFTASGLSDTPTKDVVNDFYLYCKANGIYNLLDAFYLCVGGTSAIMSYNGKNPSLYQLLYSGGLTYSSNGIKPNGSTGYADTQILLTPFDITNMHFSYYSRENTQNDAFVGAAQVGNNTLQMYLRGGFYTNETQAVIGNPSNVNMVATTTDSRGLFTISRTSSSLSKLYKNNSLLATNTNTLTTTTPIALKIFLGARNLSNTAGGFDTRQFCFSSFGKGLNDTQQGHLYTAVQTLQTALGRQV